MLFHIIAIYITSVVTSLILRTALNLKIIKDGANRGLKINFNKQMDEKEELEEDLTKGNTVLIKLDNKVDYIFPINLISVFVDTYDYTQNKEEILYDFLRDGTASKMNYLEQSIYEEKPSLVNALIIEDKVKDILDECIEVDFKTRYGTSKAFYQYTEDEKIEIVYSEGQFSRLSKDEQMRLLEEVINYSFLNAGIKKYKSLEEFSDKIKENPLKTVESIIVECNSEKELELYDKSRKEFVSENTFTFLSYLDKESLKKLKEIITIPMEYEDKELLKKIK